jgi:nucleotide-binding universal stress UspA family protein
VKLTGYDKAKTNWQTVSVSRHADSQLRGSASPVELTTHVKTLETHRESVSNFSHRYLPATTQPSLNAVAREQDADVIVEGAYGYANGSSAV